jgi:phosphate-selective porin
MRLDCISHMSQSPILSKLNSPLAEGKIEEEAEVTKKEGTIKVTLTLVEVIDNSIRIKISKVKDNNNKINIRISSLKEAEGEDQMTNQAYNAIIEKSMGTMNLNAGRSKQINSQAEHMSQIIRETPQEVCFSHATRLKNNLKIYGCWTVDAAII